MAKQSLRGRKHPDALLLAANRRWRYLSKFARLVWLCDTPSARAESDTPGEGTRDSDPGSQPSAACWATHVELFSRLRRSCLLWHQVMCCHSKALRHSSYVCVSVCQQKLAAAAAELQYKVPCRRVPMSMANRLAFSRFRNISSGGSVMLLSMAWPLALLSRPTHSAMVNQDFDAVLRARATCARAPAGGQSGAALQSERLPVNKSMKTRPRLVFQHVLPKLAFISHFFTPQN